MIAIITTLYNLFVCKQFKSSIIKIAMFGALENMLVNEMRKKKLF